MGELYTYFDILLFEEGWFAPEIIENGWFDETAMQTADTPVTPVDLNIIGFRCRRMRADNIDNLLRYR